MVTCQNVNNNNNKHYIMATMTNVTANEYNEWGSLPKHVILQYYEQELLDMQTLAKHYNISEKEINELFHECFHKVIKSHSILLKFYVIMKYVVITAFTILLTYLLINHTLTSSFIIRNAQGWIYPGFKIWRKFSLPVITYFPSLTELYDESCLIRNPVFQMPQTDCWSCKQVRLIPNLSSMNLSEILGYGQPYFVQTHQPLVSLIDLRNFYNNNKHTLIATAPRIYSSNRTVLTLDDMMNTLHYPMSSDAIYLWRINRMSAGRILRDLIPRPYVIPNLGQSTERYVLILGPHSPSRELPKAECFNVFVLQVYGHRNIVLKPSSRCKLCKTVSVVMKPSSVLVFNWLQYKAFSLPSELNNSESITFIGSYC